LALSTPIGEARATTDRWLERLGFRPARFRARLPCCSARRRLGCPLTARVGDEVRIHWDNRDRAVDGLPVWTAQYGVHALGVESFIQECRDFAIRLLVAMDGRIRAIEAGAVRAQTVLNPRSLRAEQETWRAEFESYFREYQPDIAWQEAERALEAIATRAGLPF
jgi:hypothetical protein